MNGYLDHIVRRASGAVATITPRPRSRYEPEVLGIEPAVEGTWPDATADDEPAAGPVDVSAPAAAARRPGAGWPPVAGGGWPEPDAVDPWPRDPDVLHLPAIGDRPPGAAGGAVPLTVVATAQAAQAPSPAVALPPAEAEPSSDDPRPAAPGSRSPASGRPASGSSESAAHSPAAVETAPLETGERIDASPWPDAAPAAAVARVVARVVASRHRGPAPAPTDDPGRGTARPAAGRGHQRRTHPPEVTGNPDGRRPVVPPPAAPVPPTAVPPDAESATPDSATADSATATAVRATVVAASAPPADPPWLPDDTGDTPGPGLLQPPFPVRAAAPDARGRACPADRPPTVTVTIGRVEVRRPEPPPPPPAPEPVPSGPPPLSLADYLDQRSRT